jgi:hypothetical protein
MAEIPVNNPLFDIEVSEIVDLWKGFVVNRTPHASLRIGDAEAIIAAHDTILTMEFIRKACMWFDNPAYTGVTLPNAIAREQLIQAYKEADFLGSLYQQHSWVWRPIYEMVMLYYDIKPKRTFYAFANFLVAKTNHFYNTFKDDKVLLIGSKSKQHREVLERRYGWTGIVGAIDCIDWYQVNKAKEEMENIDFDIAFSSCGTCAKILSIHAKNLGKVGIDFGSGTDTCIQADDIGLYAWEWHGNPLYQGR